MQRSIIDNLMKEHGISRTMANNLFRKRVTNKTKDPKTEVLKTKRVSVSRGGMMSPTAYRQARKKS